MTYIKFALVFFVITSGSYAFADPKDRDLSRDYEAQKAAFIQTDNVRNQAFLKRVVDGIYVPPRGAHGIGLRGCNAPDSYRPVGSKSFPGVSRLAMRIGHMESIFRSYQVSESAWQYRLQTFEAEALRRYREAPVSFNEWLERELKRFTTLLADHLNEVAATSSPYFESTVFYDADSCGEGESKFFIETRPAGSSVILISRWNYHYCQALEEDPFGADNCAGTRYAPPTLINVVGDYRYRVKWPDGETSEGFVDFSGKSSDEATVILTPNGITYKEFWD